ncbi:MAG: immunoglobulin domain-containing protein [Verrucomicrobiota bacterium]
MNYSTCSLNSPENGRDRAGLNLIILLFALLSMTGSANAQSIDRVNGTLITFTPDGAWSWFQDERVMVVNGKILMGTVASQTQGNLPIANFTRNPGDIIATTFDPATGKRFHFELHDQLEYDDHNAPGFVRRPDGRIVTAYSKHTTGNFIYFRTTVNPDDSTSWGAETTFTRTDPDATGGNDVTYNNLHYLPTEGTGQGRIYDFFRSRTAISWDRHCIFSDDLGQTWNYGGRLTGQSNVTVRPYIKYADNGNNRIYFLTTENNGGPSVWSGYIEAGKVYRMNGTVSDANLFDNTAPSVNNLTSVLLSGTVMNGASMQALWSSDLALDASGNPIATFRANANGNGNDRRHMYARWTGTQWFVVQAAFAGAVPAGITGTTSLDVLDPNDPSIIYFSANVDPAANTPILSAADGLQHFEMFRGQTTNGGTNWTYAQLTSNSSCDNFRPTAVKWDAQHSAVFWLRGKLNTWTDYDVAIVGMIFQNEIQDPLTYVDATPANTLRADGLAFTPTSGTNDGPGGDNQWHWRTDAALGNAGTLFTVGELTPFVEDAPVLKTTISGLTAGTYDLFALYWSPVNADWRLQAALDYDGDGSVSNEQMNAFERIGTQASHINEFTGTVLTEQSTNRLYRGYVGRKTIAAGELLDVFVDNLPLATATSSGTRTWYDGIAYRSVISPPAITSHPVSRANVFGTTANFSVVATGAAPLVYQWKKNNVNIFDGGNISGATSATLSLANVAAGDAANYSVVITNSLGTITSSAATLTVVSGLPSVTSQPSSRTNNAGTIATFSISATGSDPLNYQWRKNSLLISDGGNISGATSTTLMIANVLAADAGTYSVVVTNSLGSTNSLNATLTVIDPVIDTQPLSRANAPGTTATFSVVAAGTAPISYQWRKDNVDLSNAGNVSGATSSTLTLNNVSPGDAANYAVVVSNFFGSVTSSPAMLILIDPPGIVTQPQSLTNHAGTVATFSVVASGTAPLNYQWRFNGNDLTDANGTSYTRNGALPSHAGDYTVVVVNAAGSISSSIATLSVTGSVQTVTLTNLWNIRAGSRPYVTTANTERGLALNPVSNHTLLVSRSSQISGSLGLFILDSETGNELGTMNVTGINGGTFKLSKIGVTEDGVIYAANLTTGSPGTPFVIYRWANESSAPTVAYSGPGGNTARWGDTFDLRGAGTNTQIIVAAAAFTSPATNAVIFTTTNGTNFAATIINPSPAIFSGEFSRGLSFGAGNTFFSKHNSTISASQYSFDLATGTATLIAGIDLDTTMIATGLDLTKNLLAGVLDDNSTINANHRLNVYNVSDFDAPMLVGDFTFPPNFPEANTNNSGNGNFLASVDTDGTRIVALDTQNGIVALKIILISAPAISMQPQSRTKNAGTTATFTVSATGTAPLNYQWKKNNLNILDGGNISGATSATLTLSNVSSSDAADYTVTISNAGGSLDSSAATLTLIVPQAHFDSAQVLPDGRFQLVASGGTNFAYTIEASTNLVNWLPLTNIFNQTGTFEFTDDAATNHPYRFYRAR